MSVHIHHSDAEFGDIFRIHRRGVTSNPGYLTFDGAEKLHTRVFPHADLLYASAMDEQAHFLSLEDGQVFEFMDDDMVEVIGTLKIQEVVNVAIEFIPE